MAYGVNEATAPRVASLAACMIGHLTDLAREVGGSNHLQCLAAISGSCKEDDGDGGCRDVWRAGALFSA
jgi:hypothetical protein